MSLIFRKNDESRKSNGARNNRQAVSPRNVSLALFFLISVFAFSISALAFNKGIREITNPTFSQPVFLQPGGVVRVEFNAPYAGTASEVVFKAFDTGVLTSVSTTTKLAAGVNNFDVKLPKALAPGMYDLCVATAYALYSDTDCQPHSVIVVESFDPPFTFAQVSDYHMGDPRAEKQFPGIDIKKVRLAAIEAANTANPAFVLFTGDLAAYPKTYETDYPAVLDELQQSLRVPVVTLPGNHDLYAWRDDEGRVVEGRLFWADFFGAEKRTLDYGPLRFILFNSYGWDMTTRNYNREYHNAHGTTHTYQGALNRENYKFIVDALKTAGGRMPILVAHHNPRSFEITPHQWCRDCTAPGKFVAMLSRAGVPYYLFGHVHSNQDYVERGVRFISATATGSDVEKKDLWGIRLYHVDKDLKIEMEVIRLFDEPPMKQ